MENFYIKIKKQEEKIEKLTLIKQKQLEHYGILFGIATCILIITTNILDYYFDSVLLKIISLFMFGFITFDFSFCRYFTNKLLLKIFFYKK